MNNLKAKLKSIWMILKADGFDVAVTFPTKRGFMFESNSVFGKDNNANRVHWHIGNYFNLVIDAIEAYNKEMEKQKDETTDSDR